jgi:molybdate transport system substrate-binding protein
MKSLRLLFVFALAASAQTPVRALVSNGVKTVVEELQPQAEKAVGHALAIQFGTTASLKQRIEAGETFDVAMLTSDAMDALVKAGKIAASTRADFGRCGIGMAVRSGAVKPDIKTPEALKNALRNAKSVTYAEDGASRVYIDQMVEKLGLTENVKPKTLLTQGSVKGMTSVAEGHTELGFTLISEILPIHGVELVGPLPAALQNYVNFSAGVGAKASQTDAAKAVVKFLVGPGAAAVYKAKGLEPR